MRTLSLSVLTALVAGCGTPAPTGVVELRLVDGAPTRVGSRAVTVSGAEGYVAGQGWLPLSHAAITLDLSQLRGGAFQVLGRAHLVSGHFQTIRLHIERPAPAGASAGLSTADDGEMEEVDSDADVEVDLDHCSHGDIEVDLDEDGEGHKPVAHVHKKDIDDKCDDCEEHGGSSCMPPPPPTCTGVVCPTGQICQAGACVPDPCLTIVCPTGQICQAGACIPDPCATIVCPVGQVCIGGACH